MNRFSFTNNIITFLKQPYPIIENKWWIIIPISLFVTSFLVIFQPFGLGTIEHPLKLYIFIGYGTITFLVLIFDLILIPKIFKQFFDEKYWTVGKNLLFIFLILFTIGLGNFIYSEFFFSFNNSLFKILLLFQFFTLVVGAFPSIILVIINQNRLLKSNLSAAKELSNFIETDENDQKKKSELIKIKSESGNDDVNIIDTELLFIEAQGNYVSVVHFHKKKVQRKLIRTTMKKIEVSLSSYNYLFRCHRAYILNLNQIKSISGNSQGIQLKLKNIDQVILVSRSFVKDFKLHFQK